MLIKLIMIVIALLAIAVLAYLFMSSGANKDRDPRAGKPENDLLKSKNFKLSCQYLLECPDFVDHKEGNYLLITDLATMAKKNDTEWQFKDCQKAIDISYGETKLKLIVSDVAPPETPEMSQHALGTLRIFVGTECVLKTRTEVMNKQDQLTYRVWTDQEAVSLIKDGPWLSDFEALVSELIKSSEHQHATSNMLSGAFTGAALGMELNNLDE